MKVKNKLSKLYKEFKTNTRLEDTGNAIEFLIIVCVLVLG